MVFSGLALGWGVGSRPAGQVCGASRRPRRGLRGARTGSAVFIGRKGELLSRRSSRRLVQASLFARGGRPCARRSHAQVWFDGPWGCPCATCPSKVLARWRSAMIFLLRAVCGSIPIDLDLACAHNFGPHESLIVARHGATSPSRAATVWRIPAAAAGLDRGGGRLGSTRNLQGGLHSPLAIAKKALADLQELGVDAAERPGGV